MDLPEIVTPKQYSLPASSANQQLTPLDLIIPRVYGARWILCFPLSPAADKTQIYQNLHRGLAHTIHSIPWIAGNIGLEQGSDPDHNRVQILDSESGGVLLRYKDLSADLPSYGDLKQQQFPLAKLPTAQLSPVGVMPEPPAPVLAAQANFIKDGLLLAVAIHHSAGDAVALENIMSAWAQNTAAAASGGPADSNVFTSYDGPSNDRSALMQGTQPDSAAKFPEYILSPTEKQPAGAADDKLPPPAAFQMPPMALHTFYFAPAKLAGLKRDADAYSTNDALCAFVWCHMLASRKASSPSPTTEGATSAFAYAVNIRGSATPPLPPTYMGNAAVAGMTDRLALSELLTVAPEGDVQVAGLQRSAAAIRKSLQRYQSPSNVSETVGLLGSRPDPTDYKLAYHAFLGPDVVATSWSDLGVYSAGWGDDLGSPEFFRIPGDGADGIVTILPRRSGDDGLEVVVGLEAGAMSKLLESKEFLRVAELRC